MKEIDTLLKKHNNFKGAQIRSVVNLTETSKVVTLVEQDDDGEDIHIVKLTFTGIQSSRILDGSVLSFLDTLSGISLIEENNLYGFAVGSCNAMLNVHNSPMYIVAEGITID